jgi:hypothetical protein
MKDKKHRLQTAVLCLRFRDAPFNGVCNVRAVITALKGQFQKQGPPSLTLALVKPIHALLLYFKGRISRLVGTEIGICAVNTL